MHLRSALGVLAWAAAAHAQVLQPTPPLDPELATRAELLRSQHLVEPPRSQLETELSRPGVHAGLRVAEGTVVGVDPATGAVKVRGPAGVHALQVTPRTRFVSPRPGPMGVENLSPGQEVRATYTPEGEAREVQVAQPPRVEAPGVPRKLPRTNPTAPNPSAPEPRNDRAPGDTPGNKLPW